MNKPLQQSRTQRLTEVRKQRVTRDSRFEDPQTCPDCGQEMSPFGSGGYKCTNCGGETRIH